MPFAKLTDTFDDDLATVVLSANAIALYVCSLTWASRHCTGGFVPAANVRRLTGYTKKAVKELCRWNRGPALWSEFNDGYVIRGFIPGTRKAESKTKTKTKRKNFGENLREI